MRILDVSLHVVLIGCSPLQDAIPDTVQERGVWSSLPYYFFHLQLWTHDWHHC